MVKKRKQESRDDLIADAQLSISDAEWAVRKQSETDEELEYIISLLEVAISNLEDALESEKEDA